MKIVHVITAFGIGGAEKLLLNIINLQVKKHEVHLIYLKPIDDLIHELDPKVNIVFLSLSLSIRKNILSKYKSIQPDIIHTHLVHADLLGLWSARNLNVKLFCTLHNTSIKKNLVDKIIFAIYRRIFKKIAKNLQLIAISQSVKDHAINSLNVQEARVNLLYNAISPLARITEQTEVVKSKNKLNILYVGRLEKQKSVDTLLRSIHYLKNNGYDDRMAVFIIGEGKLMPSLKKLSYKLKIDEIVNYLDKTTNVDHYFKMADLFILPSIWEGFGIVILEAFRASVPVISTNIEGPSELITNNVNGLLFEPKNHLELSEKIILLLEDKKKRIAIGKKGLETFTSKFHIEEYVNSLIELYERELND